MQPNKMKTNQQKEIDMRKPSPADIAPPVMGALLGHPTGSTLGRSAVSKNDFRRRRHNRVFGQKSGRCLPNLVGLACCPNDAAPEIQEVSNYVSYKKGGEGCVRDIIEQVLRVQGKWQGNVDAK